MTEQPEERRGYRPVDYFFRNAKPCSIQEDVRRQIAEENAIMTMSQAYRLAGINGEAWSELGNKVFGAEGR